MTLGKLVGFLAIIIGLYILWRIKQVLLLAFAAIVFATVINRLVRLLQKQFNLNRQIAIAISISSVLIFVVGFIALIIPPFVEQFQELVTLVPKGLEQLSSWTKGLSNLLPNYLVREVRNFQGLEAITQNLRTLIETLIGNFFN
jgi:predicted PurR-regulated permease PerM